MKCHNLTMLTMRDLGQTLLVNVWSQKFWVLSAEEAPSLLSRPKAVRGTGLGLC